jgi:membrane-associated phospholipid phosphatase
MRNTAVVALASALLVGTPVAAFAAAPYPSDSTAPNLVPLLAGYNDYWTPSGANDLHGTVKDGATLAKNDELTVWINNNATKAQQFKALQDAEYNNAQGTAYDQSLTIADGLGSVLGPLYVQGTNAGQLPLTKALINSSNGTSGAYVSTGTAKATFSYPRPYLPASTTATLPAGDDQTGCAPAKVNSSSVAPTRVGKSYAPADRTLNVVRVPDVTDTTHAFSPNDVALTGGYGQSGICTGGSFPSGHTTTAYQAGITLATILPELAPEILTRASEAGNDRIVLGVHYPLDIMGGRIDGEVALATRWSDTKYRTEVLEPARAELLNYLQTQCGGTIAACEARGTAYTSNPYGGAAMPGGTAQTVTNRASAVDVYRERLTYGFAPTGATNLAPSVPATASNLLLSAFPTLTDGQRAQVLAQTEIASGYPLDQSTTSTGSWERLNLAAATSATVQLAANGTATVVATGGTARVIPAAVTTPAPAPAPTAGTTAPTATVHLPVVSG